MILFCNSSIAPNTSVADSPTEPLYFSPLGVQVPELATAILSLICLVFRIPPEFTVIVWADFATMPNAFNVAPLFTVKFDCNVQFIIEITLTTVISFANRHS